MMQVVIGNLEWDQNLTHRLKFLFLEYIKATYVSPVKVLNFNFVSHFDYLILYEHTIILNVCNNVRAFP
jgi:hypothetical protein